MQLPDEAVGYEYRGLLAPPHEEWSPAAELRRATSFPGSTRPILIGMADRNEDDLNALNRKGLPD